MAKQTVKIRKKKTGGNSGYLQCNICKGQGRVKKKNRKKG